MLPWPSPPAPSGRAAPLALLALLAGGCDAPDEALGEGEVPAGRCAVQPEAFEDLRVEESEIATVPVVQWSTAAAVQSHIAWEGADGLLRASHSAAASATHRFTARGVHAGETIALRAVFEEGDTLVCSEVLPWTAGSLPASLPVLSTEGAAIDAHALIPLFTEESNALAVVDGAGAYVWYAENDPATWRVRPARDGDAMLINHHPRGIALDGSVERVEWDGSRAVLATAAGLHTDFVELPDGVVAGLVWDVRTRTDGTGRVRTLIGDAVVEFPPDAEPRTVWSIWDDFEPDLALDWPTGDGALDGVAEDWSHANSISHDLERDQYLVTVTSLQGVVAVDRSSGALAWAAGAVEGDVVPDGPDTLHNPHSVARAEGDRYLVFNRGEFGTDCSNATWFDLDTAAGTATTAAVYAGQSCTNVTYLGQADPLPDGGAMVVWTTAGRIETVDADGALQWALAAQLGAAFGFSALTPSLYP
jgi:hypothetical protein